MCGASSPVQAQHHGALGEPPTMEESAPWAAKGKCPTSTLSSTCLPWSNWTTRSSHGWNTQDFASLCKWLPHKQKASHSHSPLLSCGLRAAPNPSAEDSTSATPLGVFFIGLKVTRSPAFVNKARQKRQTPLCPSTDTSSPSEPGIYVLGLHRLHYSLRVT